MPHSIVFHAGFHKTGTTTIQQSLRKNKALLRADVEILLRRDMIALCEAARACSIDPSALNLGFVQYETVEVLQKYMGFKGTVLLSSEDLAGHMPGRHGLTSYERTPLIIKAITQASQSLFPQAQHRAYFGLREAKAWLASCYVQHLRSTRICQTGEDYMQAYQSSANFAPIVQEIGRILPVVTYELERCKSTAFGPLTPLLDLLDISKDTRRRFCLLPPANVSPDGATLDKLLALNRSDLPAAQLKAAKRALLGLPM